MQGVVDTGSEVKRQDLKEVGPLRKVGVVIVTISQLLGNKSWSEFRVEDFDDVS